MNAFLPFDSMSRILRDVSSFFMSRIMCKCIVCGGGIKDLLILLFHMAACNAQMEENGKTAESIFRQSTRWLFSGWKQRHMLMVLTRKNFKNRTRKFPISIIEFSAERNFRILFGHVFFIYICWLTLLWVQTPQLFPPLDNFNAIMQTQ